MSYWNIKISSVADKSLKKHKSSQVAKKHLLFISELQKCDDPARMGKPKTGRYKNCFGRHLTGSVSMS